MGDPTALAPWPAPATAPVRSRDYGMVEFRAMASPCRIVADDADLAAEGERLVHELESRWSRFKPDSEVSAVNASGGALCVVSAETMLLFERAEFARVATRGWFNPFVLDRIEAIERAAERGTDPLGGGQVADRPLVLIPAASAVRLPEGCRFDPGGIGKGLAGDMVVEHLLRAGATSVQVELGGDVRVAGPNWVERPWEVVIVDPRDRDSELGRLTIAEGAVAMSSVLGRRWRVNGRELHHLVDPRTGTSSTSDLLAVAAASSELWWAEVAAKSALLAGADAASALMEALGVTGVHLDERGAVVVVEQGEGAAR